MREQTLKPGWKRWRFDQMAINVNDRIDNPAEADVEHYVGLEHLDTDSLKIRRWGAPTDVEATKLRFRKGDIIFGRRRAYQRKLAVAEFNGICSAHAMVLRPKTDVVLPEFLPFFMQSDLFMNRALEISVGSLSPTINWKTLATQEFALPPLEEQAQIIKMLSNIESALESHIELQRKSQQLQDSQLEDRLSYYASSLKELPLTQICQVRTGKLDSNASVEDGTYPFFTCDPVVSRIDTYEFDCDAILLAGNNAQGNFWVKMYSGKFNAYQRTYVLEVNDKNTARTEYLAAILKRTLHELKSRSLGSTTKYLTIQILSKILVPLPTIEIQDEIMSQYNLIGQAADNVSTRKQQLYSIKSQILQMLG